MYFAIYVVLNNEGYLTCFNNVQGFVLDLIKLILIQNSNFNIIIYINVESLFITFEILELQL